MSSASSWRAAATGLLVALFVFLAARDIDRPFYGLHSWDAALAAWSARNHVHYGLGYTKGITTLAVGYPPPAIAPRYLDHPQLHVLLDAASMAVLGVNEASLRLTALVVTAACLPFLSALLRRLYDEETSVLATFFYIIFPITPFFNASCWVHWVFPFALVAYWCYLILIGGLRESPPPGRRHLIGLGAALFVLPQLTWFGVFYCAALGSDYLLRRLAERRFPERRLLATLALCPLAAVLVNFGVLLYGRGGDFRSLFGVYAHRFQAFGSPERTAIKWAAKQWELVQGNFTLPVVLIVGAYLAYRLALGIYARLVPQAAAGAGSRAFVHAWIFVLPGVAVLAVFPELFWLHHMEYSWLSLPVAIAAALGVLQLRDALLTRGRTAANAAFVATVALVGVCAARGLNDYYAVRWRAPVELDMFKKLNKAIAPDQSLLTYYEYFVQEYADKAGLYRPEVAWSLDRPMVVARTLEEVEARAATGKFPFYLVGARLAPPALLEQLKARYPSELVQSNPFRADPNEAESRRQFGDQLIFDLRPEVESLMKRGLNALYHENDARKAAAHFRSVLAINSEHYGANFQLAKALDAAGEVGAARPYWTKTLELARRYADATTGAVAKARLSRGN